MDWRDTLLLRESTPFEFAGGVALSAFDAVAPCRARGRTEVSPDEVFEAALGASLGVGLDMSK